MRTGFHFPRFPETSPNANENRPKGDTEFWIFRLLRSVKQLNLRGPCNVMECISA